MLAELRAGAEAVEARQHHVEDDRVVVVSPRHPERVLAARGDVRRVARLGQAAADETRELEIVLDDEDPHENDSATVDVKEM